MEREIVERDVVDIVEGLTLELGTWRTGPLSLDESLDHDLGIGSLERVELLLRLEQAFGVHLASSVMSDAETPRDLVSAIFRAQPSFPEALPEPRAKVRAAGRVPESARTLVDVLRWQAEAYPQRVYVLLRDEHGQEEAITYGALWSEASSLAAGLRARGLAVGDSVAIMLRTEPAFFPAFFGTLLAGGIPVPIYPPFRLDRIQEYILRQAGILRNAGARFLITFKEGERVARLLRSRVPSLREVTTTEHLSRLRVAPDAIHLTPDDPALIQYTSGSTGDPKGVLLSHANILANIRAFGAAITIQLDDIAVSWLPLYHDMGLIGFCLGALYYGIPSVILSPLTFLSRPSRWLWAIHIHRATLSAAPNFAFDLCARKIDEGEIQGLDLSAWRLAFNGSETVSPETIERFTRRFGAYGLRREAVCPVYGLAEAAVALTIPPMGRGPRVDVVSREPFQRSRWASPAVPEETNPLRFVSCGCPIPGHQVRIIDGEGRPLGERIEGGIQFQGPSATSGYFRNPEATRVVLHDGWLDSGDLGYLANGELFITGRYKDTIIKAGRNLCPQEAEEAVGAIAGIRKGCVAAFGVADPQIATERLVVVAESRETAPEIRNQLHPAIAAAVISALGLPPDVILITRPGSVFKTSSGKIRRAATREAYLRGELDHSRPSTALQLARLLADDFSIRVRQLLSLMRTLGYAAYIGGLLVLTVPLLWVLLRLFPSGRASDGFVRAWCRGILALSGNRIKVEGLERLDFIGPAVLAANHASYLDPVALVAALPTDFRFVAKQELASGRLVGLAIRKGGHLTVERYDLSRSVANAEGATAILRRGISLLVFPEGTFGREPGILPFRLGAFKAAVDAGLPVIPVAIRGTREILPPALFFRSEGAL